MAAPATILLDGENGDMMNKAILDELMQLSPSERLDIAGRLWESVDPNDPNIVDDIAPLSEEQMQEVRRRVAEHERDPNSAIPWDEIRARLWARVK
jgi:putative addiction module component (TIGR02574 family)